MNFEDLTPEQQEKAKACKTTEELMALAAQEGVELSDEMLDAVSGGGAWNCIDHCSDYQKPCVDHCSAVFY